MIRFNASKPELLAAVYNGVLLKKSVLHGAITLLMNMNDKVIKIN